MGITDELRKWGCGFCGSSYEDVNAIADRIDAEHQKAIWELNNLADASVLLPVDAEGVPIRVGDVMESKGGERFKVKFISLHKDVWRVNVAGWTPSKLRHYHEPTVEDVLRDFAYCCEEGATEQSIDEIIVEYAAKLRLANREE